MGKLKRNPSVEGGNSCFLIRAHCHDTRGAKWSQIDLVFWRSRACVVVQGESLEGREGTDHGDPSKECGSTKWHTIGGAWVKHGRLGRGARL